MAAGEKTFSVKGRELRKFDKTPIPAGDWEVKLRGSQAEVAAPNDPEGMPYVKARFEALGTSKEEGQPNKLFFHNFFLGVSPGKDGKAAVDNEEGIVAVIQAAGEDPSIPVRHGKFAKTTNKGKADEKREMVEQDYLDPQAVAEWLMEHDGHIFKVHSKVQPARDGYDAKGVIERFYIPEDAEVGAEDIGSIDEEVEAEETEEAEPTPPPKKTAPAKGKAAPKRR